MNIDEMLFKDMLWLVDQAERLPLGEFKKIALELDDKNWERFWKLVRERAHKQLCIINGRAREMTTEEMEVLEQLLGKPEKRECWVY